MAIYYILGILTGLVLASIAFIGALLWQSPIKRSISQIQAKLRPMGTIINAPSEEAEEVDAWINDLKNE